MSAPVLSLQTLTVDPATGNVYPVAAGGNTLNLPAGSRVGGVAIGTGTGLPSMTGNTGKLLTTDGSSASWATSTALSLQTTTGTLALGGFPLITGSLSLFPGGSYAFRDLFTLASDEVDNRLVGLTAGNTAQNLFSSGSGAGPYVRSATHFAHDVDLTCVSVYNNEPGGSPPNYLKTATLISPRHVLLASHFYPAIGTTFYFQPATGASVSRALSAVSSLIGIDIRIGYLDSDVPATITFAKTFTPAQETHIDAGATVFTDQNQKLYVAQTTTSTGYSNVYYPTVVSRQSFDKAAFAVGDSSHPVFAIIDGQAVLLGAFYSAYGTNGSAPSISANIAAINSAMTSLGGSYQLTPFKASVAGTAANYDAGTTVGKVALLGAGGTVTNAYGLYDGVNGRRMVAANDNELAFTNISDATFDAGSLTAFRSGLGLVIGTNVQAYNAGLSLPIGAAYGGTGVANNAAATLTRSGNHALTLTTTGTTGVTFPTSGTLLSTAGNLAGLNDPSDARDNLGLGDAATSSIGIDVQAYDADLTTWAGITPGTGVGTALGVNVGSAGAFVTFNGAGGTPSSMTGTNITGTATAFNINGTVGATTPAAGTFTTGIFGSTTSLLLGTAGSAVGNIGFRNATSGTATLAPPTGALGTYTVTLPNAASTIPIASQQITWAGPTAARTYTLPDAAVTLASLTGTETLSNKTLTAPKIAKIVAPSDSTTAIQITAADGSTAAGTWDTTNLRLGLGVTPSYVIDILAPSSAALRVRSTVGSAGLKFDSAGTAFFDFATNGTNKWRLALAALSGAQDFIIQNQVSGRIPIYISENDGVSIGSSTDAGTNNLLIAGGIVGTTAAGNAAAGNVGEQISASVVQGSATALTTATPKTVTSIPLTAGDWDVTAVGCSTGASTGTVFDVAISANNNSFTGTVLGDSRCQTPTVSLTGADASLMIPQFRVNISANTTYYLVVSETFTIGSPAAYGRISARRRR